MMMMMMRGWRVVGFAALAGCASAKELFDEAKDAERKKQYAVALEKYREAIDKDPDDVAMHREYQNFMIKADQRVQVQKEYEAKMQSQPVEKMRDRSVAARWVYLYGRLLRDQELVEHMEAALRLDPNFDYAHLALVVYFVERRRWREALDHVEFFLKLPGRPPETVRVYAATCYSNLGMEERAEQELEAACREPKRSANPVFELGILHLNQKKFETAVKNLEEALRLDPAFVKAYAPLAQAYHAANRLDPAAETRRRGREWAEAEWARTAKGATEFLVVLERMNDEWMIKAWERISPGTESSVERGKWVYVARLIRSDQKITIQYALKSTEALRFVLERTVLRGGEEQKILEPVKTTEISSKDDFDTFYRRVLIDSADLRDKYVR